MVGAGMTMAPMRMAPSIAVYHCEIRGSITKTGSPLPTPSAV